jgi:Glycosyl hydrolase family 26
MKSRLAMVIAVVAALIAIFFTAGGIFAPRRPPAPPAHASLPPTLASYLGVFEPGSPPGYQSINDFAAAAGRSPNLVGYFSGWAEPFEMAFARSALAHHAIPFVQIDPTYASVPAIAAGVYDGYLRSYAASVRSFGHSVVIGFGHEMNGNWYSWGSGHVRPQTFVAAWRHIVTVFRRQGADNVTWLWTIDANRHSSGPVSQWWPGPQYVTWIGLDGFYYRSSDTFASVFGKVLGQVRSFTNKPVLLSETAVGPAAGQYVKIQDLFRGMVRYGTLGLVWFDILQNAGIYHQDWRIEDNPGAKDEFRLGIRDDLTASGSQ